MKTYILPNGIKIVHKYMPGVAVSHCGLIQPQLYQESQLKLFYEFKEDESNKSE